MLTGDEILQLTEMAALREYKRAASLVTDDPDITGDVDQDQFG